MAPLNRAASSDCLATLLFPVPLLPLSRPQGSKSVEVRPVGVSKGASMERILQYMSGESSTCILMLVCCIGWEVIEGASMERIVECTSGR